VSFEEKLLGKTREWELLRGIFNNRFNKIINNKEERKEIFDLWVYSYEQLKNKIWIKRCDEVIEMERKRGIEK
jgi:hypothetical protein